MDVEMKISRSRTRAFVHAPFYGAVLLGLPSREAPTQETMATDGKAVLFNRKFVEELTEPELLFVNCHEALHVAFCHHLRMGDRNPQAWNVATDYAINGILIDAGIGEMPEGGLHDTNYRGMSAEQIYNSLIKHATADPVPCPWGGVEKPKNDDGTDYSPEQLIQAEAEVAQKVINAATKVKSIGKDVPDAISTYVEELLKPKVDWCDVLRRFTGGEQPDGLDWSRISKKHYHTNRMVMPTIDRVGVGDLVVGIDSSASLDDDELAQFVSELNAVTDELVPSSVTIIVCDRIIRDVIRFEQGEVIYDLGIKGRGGTAVTPVFDYVYENELKVDKFIYFTDLDVHDFPDEPEFPVLWVSTRKSDAPWGEIAMLN